MLPVSGCRDITYIPVKNGLLYLVAIRCPAMVFLQTMRRVDWATRKVLTWLLSNTLEEAISKYGKPEIMNTDQGSQYTGSGWITTLTEPKIKIPPSVCMQTPAGNRWAGAAIWTTSFEVVLFFRTVLRLG